MNRFFILIILVLSIQNVKSVDLNLKRYTVKDGLVQSQVYTIVQSPDGYLWIGTAAGLSRFDGKKFVTFFRRDGLAGNVIRCGMRDKEGNLWFGHYSGKITKYNWKSKKFESITISENKAFRVLSLVEDSKGNLWAGTNSNGLFLYAEGKWKNFKLNSGLHSNYLNDLQKLDYGYIIAASDKGPMVFRYNEIKDKLEILNLPQADMLRNLSINNISIDSVRNTIWMSTQRNSVVELTFRKTKDSYRFLKFKSRTDRLTSSVKCVSVSNDSQLWLATRRKGIFVAGLNESSDNLVYVKYLKNDLGIDKYRIYDIFCDHEGNIWIGSNGNGLYQYRNTKIQLTSINLDRPVTSVWSIHEDKKNRLWIGTEGEIALATQNNLGVDKIKYLSNLKMGHIGKKQVINIKEDKTDNIYYTSWGNGVFELDPKTMVSKKYVPYKGFPQKIVKDMVFCNEETWFATEGSGIIRYNNKTGIVKTYSLFDNNIKINRFYEIFKDSQGRIWFGSFSHGVVKYDNKGFSVYNLKNGFPLKSVFSFAEDYAGNIWFISYSGAFAKYDGKKFIDYSFAKGIDGQPVYSAVSDDSTLWVSAPEGILRYEAHDSSFSNYFSINGFQISEANTGAVYRDSKGDIWFGMVDGLLRLKPENKEIPSLPIALNMEKVQLYFKDIHLPPNNRFNYDNNNLTFYYKAVSLINPERVRYSYKLKGYDKDWSPPFRENKVTYANLPPGEYTLNVKACDSYGRWLKKPLTYNFEIMAPFWRTWPFYLIVAFSVIIIGVYAYIRRVRMLEKYNSELETEVKKRVAELSEEKEKVEFALKALRESEKKFRIFAETTESAIFIVKNRMINYINPAGEKLIGYEEDELRKLNPLNFIHKDFLEQIEKYLSIGYKSRQMLKTEIIVIHKSGAQLWIALIIKPIVYDDEQIFIGTVLNINERKLAEKRLVEEKERLSVTLSSITDGVITTDSNGTIILMNRVAEKISGYSYHDAIGKNVNDVLNIKDNEENHIDLFDKSLHKLKDISDEYEGIISNKNQKKMFVEYSRSLVRDSVGKISGMVFAIRDMTNRKRMTDEMLKANKLESLGVLAGGIAHDFNNILTAVIGNLSLAKMKIHRENEAYKWLELSEKSSFRAKELTRKLLTFSKGGQPIKDNAPIDNIINDTVSFILSGSKIKPEIHFSENLPDVNMDSGQISQAIQNIIINAKQAMPDGGIISIDVTTCELQKNANRALKEGYYIKIIIKDSGKGIAAKDIDKIFDPFYSTREDGSGLGLSTAYSIIKNHNGSITVESTVNKGTTFTILLPAAKRDGQSGKDKKVNQKMSKGYVLVMDDEELVLETASAMLEFLGYKVEKAENGQKAVELYQRALNNHPFAAVIMDLTIPGGMGGKEAVQEILKIDPEAQVIVSSGYSNDPVMADYEKYGFKGRIQKPYNLKELSQLLKTHFQS